MVYIWNAKIMTSESKFLPIEAKGKRPQFLDSPGLDKAISIITALVGEVSVLHDEIDTLKRILIEKKIIDKNQDKSFSLDDNAKKEREEWRELYIENVFRVIEQDVKSMQNQIDKDK